MLSEETKRKISEHHHNVKGENNPMFGKHHTEETKIKIREKRLGKYIGEKSPTWKGGRFKNSSGYILIYSPHHPHAINGYVREHRLVVEKKIGRYLENNELVHHKNKVKSDNREENLEIVNKREHNRIHIDHNGRKRDKKGKWL